MCNGAWRHVGRMTFDANCLVSIWWCVWTPMVARLPQLSRSVQGDHSGTCKRLIGSRFTAMMEGVVVFGVWDSSMAAVAGPEPKDDN